MDSNEKKGNKIKLYIFGSILVIAGTIIVYVGEEIAIRKQISFREGASHVIDITGGTVLPGHNGKLVYIKGIANTREVLKDEEFGIEVNAIHLRRSVEIYQWIENVAPKEGSDEKQYNYQKEWKSGLTSSRSFKDTTGHVNPKKVPYTSKWLVAEKVSIGPFELDKVFVNKINKEESIDVAPMIRAEKQGVKVDGNMIYVGTGDMKNPSVGDVRLKYTCVKPQMVSVIGRQKREVIDTYVNRDKSKISMLETGDVSSDKMFAVQVNKNAPVINILRLSGLLLIFLGISILYNQLKYAGSQTVLFRRVFAGGRLRVTFLLTALIILVILALSWTIYNPLLGGAFGAIALFDVVYLLFFQKYTET